VTGLPTKTTTPTNTDDHQGDRERVRPADVESREGEDLAPDVADAPDFEPPD
jgi:hypothetical protein